MRLLTRIYNLLTEPFRRSIRNRLILVMIFLSAAPLILVTVLATENTRKSMEAEIVQSNMSGITWTGQYLEEQLTGLNNIIYTLLISSEFNDYLNKSDSSSLSQQFSAQRSVISMMTSLYYSGNNNLVGIQLYLKEPNKLFTINDMFNDIKTPGELPQSMASFFKRDIDFLVEEGDSKLESFHLLRRINRFENKEVLGAVLLEIKWRTMDNILDLLHSETDQTVLITDHNGEPMYNPEKAEISDELRQLLRQIGDGPGLIRDKNYYVFSNTIDPWGLKVVKLIPTVSINESAQRTMQYGLIVGVVSIIVSLMAAVFVAWKMAGPIVRLTRNMKGIRLLKDGEQLPLSNRIDEIGLLEWNMQNMSHRIREHIRTEYIINLEKRTAQLKALQSQINPHFLQNTLQLIGSMAFSKKPNEIYEIIRSLSEMFRYVIREPDELVTVRRETDYLKHYMLIQKERFAERIEYEIYVDKALERCLIPKLTLQPLIENAFMHGLDRKTSDWKICVRAITIGNRVEITVEDNGVGMNEEALAKLQEQLDQPSDLLWASERIGLHNVAARIKLHFGEQYGVHVESRPGEGTFVQIRMPLVQKDGEA
ncbi:sensor histidine kinase [Paenibacillus abyssi]|uniref:Sensor histidine kinase YesM n=1 Tax=Paenibacillus abyssi TaxID=1340531 RepID=A0A917G0L9_9BACL|nr:sensor histidine kinase [Paenibacillus abyssi]GGG16648.1 sensor histidine kinase YesM [Paenibacillus abyssi]